VDRGKLTSSSSSAQAQNEHLHGHRTGAVAAVDVGIGRKDIGARTRLVRGGISHFDGVEARNEGKEWWFPSDGIFEGYLEQSSNNRER
jgi:hypothetical protein